MLGINPGQAIGFPIDSVWPALPAWPNSHALSSNQSEIPREVIVSQGENRRTLDLRVSAILDRQGVFTGRLAVLRDITPRKRAEAALQRRDLILQAVSFAAEQFLKSTTWEQNIREVLTRLGYGRDPRLVNLLQLIRQKQDPSGRWNLEYDYTGKTWGSYGAKGQPNKYVTLRALRVLKAVG